VLIVLRVRANVMTRCRCHLRFGTATKTLQAGSHRQTAGRPGTPSLVELGSIQDSAVRTMAPYHSLCWQVIPASPGEEARQSSGNRVSTSLPFARLCMLMQPAGDEDESPSSAPNPPIAISSSFSSPGPRSSRASSAGSRPHTELNCYPRRARCRPMWRKCGQIFEDPSAESDCPAT